MVGVIIVTHGNLGQEMLVAVERMLGAQEYVKVIAVNPMDGLDGIRARLKQVLEDDSFPEEKLIIVDIFGGTPSNASLTFVNEPGLEIIGGLNLPSLVTLFSERERAAVGELAEKIVLTGSKGVIDIKKLMLERLGNKK